MITGLLVLACPPQEGAHTGKQPPVSRDASQEMQQGASQSTSFSVGATAVASAAGALRGSRGSGVTGDSPLLSVMGYKACESRGS